MYISIRLQYNFAFPTIIIIYFDMMKVSLICGATCASSGEEIHAKAAIKSLLFERKIHNTKREV